MAAANRSFQRNVSNVLIELSDDSAAIGESWSSARGGDIGPVKESSRQLCRSWLSVFQRRRAKRQDEVILPGQSPVGRAGAVEETSDFLKLPYQSRRTASGQVRPGWHGLLNDRGGWFPASPVSGGETGKADAPYERTADCSAPSANQRAQPLERPLGTRQLLSRQ